MEQWTAWAISITIFSVCSVLFRLLMPDGNVKKAGDFLLSLFMVLLLVKPFIHANFSENISYAPLDDEVYTVKEDTLLPYREAIRRSIEDVLEKKEIKSREIEIICEKGKDGNIILEHVTIFLYDADDKGTVLQLLEKELEIPSELITLESQAD